MDWYVNLKNEAAVKWKRVGKYRFSGRNVDWTLTWEPGAHANHVKTLPSLKLGTPLGDDGLSKRTAEARGADHFKNELVFAPPGGVKYTVKVKKAAGQGTDNVDGTYTFTAWRKVFYSVNYMGEDTLRTFKLIEGEMQDIFKKLFINLVRHEEPTATTRDEPETKQVAADATVAGLHSGTAGPKPHWIRFIIVRDVYGETGTPFLTAEPWTPAPSAADGFSWDAATRVLSLNTGITKHWFVKRLVPKSLYGEKSPFGTLVSVDLLSAPGLATVTTTMVDNKFVLHFDLTQPCYEPLLTEILSGRKVKLNLATNLVASKGGGYAKGTTTAVMTTIKKDARESAETSQNRLLWACCHELAHGLGVVVDAEQTKAGNGTWSQVPNALHYEGKGGTGPHCSTGATEGADGLMAPTPGAKVCVMHHAISPDGTLEDGFCAVCSGHLLRNACEVPGKAKQYGE